MKVEVAPEVRRIFPPEIVRPDEVANSPEVVKPVYIVEVPPWKLATPCIERVEPGEVVPIPTLLLNQSTTNVFPSTVRPPAKVDVAAVEVASMTPTFR